SGATISPGDNAVMVAVDPKFEKAIPSAEFFADPARHLAEFAHANWDQFKRANRFLGAYDAGDTVYLDVSEGLADVEEAVRRGIERGQESIFDAASGDLIYVDTA